VIPGSFVSETAVCFRLQPIPLQSYFNFINNFIFLKKNESVIRTRKLMKFQNQYWCKLCGCA